MVAETRDMSWILFQNAFDKQEDWEITARPSRCLHRSPLPSPLTAEAQPWAQSKWAANCPASGTSQGGREPTVTKQLISARSSLFQPPLQLRMSLQLKTRKAFSTPDKRKVHEALLPLFLVLPAWDAVMWHVMVRAVILGWVPWDLKGKRCLVTLSISHNPNSAIIRLLKKKSILWTKLILSVYCVKHYQSYILLTAAESIPNCTPWWKWSYSVVSDSLWPHGL